MTEANKDTTSPGVTLDSLRAENERLTSERDGALIVTQRLVAMFGDMTCHEPGGEYSWHFDEPCGQPAVALTRDPDTKNLHPVCGFHSYSDEDMLTLAHVLSAAQGHEIPL